LRTQEELEEEGLHLIDFEQLKIENQTLNEKIEERNDELHKLRKKTTTTVQVLTHVKEKLKFVQEENEVLIDELAGLDDQVKDLRDGLTKVHFSCYYYSRCCCLLFSSVLLSSFL
jgi:predicted nuclease with TOPRIM domain